MSKWRKGPRSRFRWRRVTELMARDGDVCSICAEPLDRKLRDENHANYITFDHIVPRSHGGTDLLSNLRLAHQLCNMRRGNDPITAEEEMEAS